MVRGSDGLFSASSPSDPGIPTPSASSLWPRSCTTLTFGAPASSPCHRAISPDLQVGLRVLGIICVEVALPDLTPKLEERAGVRDGVCLAGPQQDGQHRAPQSWVLEPGLGPSHQWLTSSGEVWDLGSEVLNSLDSILEPGGRGEQSHRRLLRWPGWLGPPVCGLWADRTPKSLGRDAEAAEFISRRTRPITFLTPDS